MCCVMKSAGFQVVFLHPGSATVRSVSVSDLANPPGLDCVSSCQIGAIMVAHLAGLVWDEMLLFFFFFNLYLFLRERQSVSRGGTEREGDTESKAGSGP